MHQLASTFRCLQLLAHNAHNLTKGVSFFADHEFFGELYPSYETAYDSVIERMIGLEVPVDLVAIQLDATDMLADISAEQMEVADFLKGILSGEKKLCYLIAEENNKATIGTQNLIAQLYDDSEVRQYKLKQRLGD